MLIDTHAHLYWDSYKTDLGKVIQRAIDAGVTTVINIGVDVDLSKTALEQVTKGLANIPNFHSYSTIAIHPEKANKYSDAESIHKDIEKLKQIYQSNPEKVVAIGECGLDYIDVDEQTKRLQKLLFQAQIDLAKELHLPLVVHVRDDRSKNPNNIEAWDEVFDFIGNHPAILHCYSGLEKTTKRAIEKTNILVSLAGNITYPKNEYLREAVKLLPLEKILLETDSPFLALQSKRGQRNEPCAIKEIAELVAQIKGIFFDEVADQTSKNAKRIFAL